MTNKSLFTNINCCTLNLHKKTSQSYVIVHISIYNFYVDIFILRLWQIGGHLI